MNKITHRIAGHQSQQSQNYQDNSDRPQHNGLPFGWFRLVAYGSYAMTAGNERSVALEHGLFYEHLILYIIHSVYEGCSWLFHNEIIPDGYDPFDAACDLTRLIDSCLRINEAAQLNDAFPGFYTDLK